MKYFIRLLFFMLLSSSSLAIANSSPTPIIFWHSMTGSWGEELKRYVDEFNTSHPRYQIIPQYKGNYSETLMSTVAAFRAHQQPHIVQVFEVGTATMMFPKGVIVPFIDLMKKAHL